MPTVVIAGTRQRPFIDVGCCKCECGLRPSAAVVIMSFDRLHASAAIAAVTVLRQYSTTPRRGAGDFMAPTSTSSESFVVDCRLLTRIRYQRIASKPNNKGEEKKREGETASYLSASGPVVPSKQNISSLPDHLQTWDIFHEPHLKEVIF